MSKEDLCEVDCANEKLLEKVKKDLLDETEVKNISAIFKALGDPTRIKILYCLKSQELCVCDISKILNMTQSAISHQLRVLRNLRIVKFRREGKMVYYSLDDEHIFKILHEGLNHIRHD